MAEIQPQFLNESHWINFDSINKTETGSFFFFFFFFSPPIQFFFSQRQVLAEIYSFHCGSFVNSVKEPWTVTHMVQNQD